MLQRKGSPLALRSHDLGLTLPVGEGDSKPVPTALFVCAEFAVGVSSGSFC